MTRKTKFSEHGEHICISMMVWIGYLTCAAYDWGLGVVSLLSTSMLLHHLAGCTSQRFWKSEHHGFLHLDSCRWALQAWRPFCGVRVIGE